MKLDDEKLKRILQDDMNREAEQILEAVENDPIAKDAVAPEGIYERLMKQIEEKEAEEQKANDDSLLSEEQKELIRLGKIYKKKRSRRKYYVVGIAAVVAMAIGMTSFGGAEKIIREVKDMMGGKTQLHIDSTGEKTDDIKHVSEEDAYQEIEDKFGFYPVRMYYLPEGMDFQEATIEEEKQLAFMHYADENDRCISYCVVTNYRTSSVGVDIEDDVIQTYEKEIQGLTIHFEEYLIKENKDKRWKVRFEYKDAHYTLLFMGIEETEVNKIIEKLEIF